MNTKQLKAKILDLLIKGELSRKWRESHKDIENASVLLEKIRAEKEKKLNDELAAKGKKPNAKVEIKAVGKEDEPFEIPASWKWCRLGDILYPMESKKPDGEKFTYIDIEAIDNVRNLIKKPKVLSVSEAPSRASRKLHYGDILFSMVRPYLRNIAFVEENYSEAIASTGFYVLTPIGVDNSFIFQFMLTSYVVNGLNKFATGDNSPSINNEHLKDFLLPLPPLEEQKELARIAEILLSMADDLDSSYRDLENLGKKAKAKILDLLIKGELSRKWRESHKDIENASVLLEKIRAEKEKKLNDELVAKGKKPNAKVEIKAVGKEDEPFEIPASWKWCRLGDIFEMNAGKSIKAENIYREKDEIHIYPCFGGNGIRGFVSEYNRDGDYPIIGRQGALCGNLKLAQNKFYATEHAVTVKCDFVDYRWAYYALDFMNLNQYATATAQPGLSVEKISLTYIPLPPLEEQKELARIAEILLRKIDQLTEMPKHDMTGVVENE